MGCIAQLLAWPDGLERKGGQRLNKRRLERESGRYREKKFHS